MIVFAFSSFVVVVAVVVPVAAVAFAFVVLSFALALAFVSFAFVVPCCSYVHWCWSSVVAVACWVMVLRCSILLGTVSVAVVVLLSH